MKSVYAIFGTASLVAARHWNGVVCVPLFAARIGLMWRISSAFTCWGLSLNIIVGYLAIFNLSHAAFMRLARTQPPLSTRALAFVAGADARSALTAAGCRNTRPVLPAGITVHRDDRLWKSWIALINNPFGLTGGPNGVLRIDKRPI